MKELILFLFRYQIFNLIEKRNRISEQLLLITTLMFWGLSVNAQIELLANGNFSETNSGWATTTYFSYNSNYTNCQVCPGYAHADNGSGQPKTNLYDYLTQEVSIPSSAFSTSLSFYTSATLSGTSVGTERLFVYVYDYTLGVTNIITSLYFTGSTSYTNYSFAIPGSCIGHSLQLGFRAECTTTACTIRVDEVSMTYIAGSSCTPATISTQPISQSTTTGNTVTFSVISAGTSPINYQWYKNFTIISGATNSTYATPILTIADNGNSYYCNITNCNGTTNLNSNTAILTITNSCIGATISIQPNNQSALSGSTATFDVIVNGTAPISFQWYKNTNIISGATNSSYTTSTLTIADNGNTYYCNITNCNGTTNLNSNTATLTVANSCLGAVISSQPISQSAIVGNTATFDVIVNGTAPISFQWYKNAIIISGATNSSYTTSILTIADNGNTYYCNISNCNGTTNINSNNVTLTVVPNTSTSPYKLPWAIGTEHTCTQGNNGEVSHTGIEEYAFDFAMPIGTDIVAARGGIVDFIKENIADNNCPSPNCSTCIAQVNYVTIDHGDGTYSLYLHLTQNGVLVDEGDQVSQGQIIAKSGNTGCSTGPHLHFMVMNSNASWWSQSIPISFCDFANNGGIPEANDLCLSLPCNSGGGTSSISYSENKKSILIFPNPSKGKVYIKNLNKSDKLIRFEIINLLGNIVYKGKFDNNIETLSFIDMINYTGYFIIKIYTNNEVFEERIVYVN